MKRILFTILLACFLMTGLEAYSQNVPRKKTQSDFVSRLRFGGYLGLQFGTITLIEVSPLVIYKANKWLYPGVGFTYMYLKDKRYTPEFTSSYWGPRIFSSFYIWRDLFAQVEYEALNVEYFDQPGTRGYIHNIMLGGGYRQMLGDRAFMMFTILYNFNESIYTPYQNPIIRIGFGVGI